MKPSDYIRKGWCQRAFARDARGNRTSPGSQFAVAWCAAGALMANGEMGRSYTEARFFDEASLGMPLAAWNDAPGRTQGEVIALLEKHGL
jgi:hypothetical protein